MQAAYSQLHTCQISIREGIFENAAAVRAGTRLSALASPRFSVGLETRRLCPTFPPSILTMILHPVFGTSILTRGKTRRAKPRSFSCTRAWPVVLKLGPAQHHQIVRQIVLRIFYCCCCCQYLDRSTATKATTTGATTLLLRAGVLLFLRRHLQR